MSNERSKTILELALPVADRFQGDFEEARNYVPSERLCRSDLKDWLEEAQINPRLSAKFTISDTTFVEFDSNNPSHAGAIYQYTATGPRELIDKLENIE